jgi:hypothetical protein
MVIVSMSKSRSFFGGLSASYGCVKSRRNTPSNRLTNYSTVNLIVDLCSFQTGGEVAKIHETYKSGEVV